MTDRSHTSWDEPTARTELQKVAALGELSQQLMNFVARHSRSEHTIEYTEGTIVSHPKIAGHAGGQTLVRDCVDDQTRSYYADDGTRADDDDPFSYTHVLRVVRTADGLRVVNVSFPITACRPDQIR